MGPVRADDGTPDGSGPATPTTTCFGGPLRRRCRSTVRSRRLFTSGSTRSSSRLRPDLGEYPETAMRMIRPAPSAASRSSPETRPCTSEGARRSLAPRPRPRALNQRAYNQWSGVRGRTGRPVIGAVATSAHSGRTPDDKPPSVRRGRSYHAASCAVDVEVPGLAPRYARALVRPLVPRPGLASLPGVSPAAPTRRCRAIRAFGPSGLPELRRKCRRATRFACHPAARPRAFPCISTDSSLARLRSPRITRAPSFGALEDTLGVHIQALKLGDSCFTICSC